MVFYIAGTHFLTAVTPQGYETLTADSTLWRSPAYAGSRLKLIFLHFAGWGFAGQLEAIANPGLGDKVLFSAQYLDFLADRLHQYP
jgi:hypothetical protein